LLINWASKINNKVLQIYKLKKHHGN